MINTTWTDLSLKEKGSKKLFLAFMFLLSGIQSFAWASNSQFVYDYMFRSYVPHGLSIYKDWKSWDLSKHPILFNSFSDEFYEQFIYKGFYNKKIDTGILFEIKRPSLSESKAYCRSDVAVRIYLPKSLEGSKKINLSSVINRSHAFTVLNFDDNQISNNCFIDEGGGLEGYILVGFEDENILPKILNNKSLLFNECKRSSGENANKFWSLSPVVGSIGTRYVPQLGKAVFYMGINASDYFGEIWLSIQGNDLKYEGCEAGFIS